MKTTDAYCLGCFVLALIMFPTLVCGQQSDAKSVQIRELAGFINSPTLVTIEGVTGEIQDLTPTVRAYLLSTRFPNDDKDKIWVKTSAGRPESNLTYRVTGTVIKDGTRLFLLEQNRERVTSEPARSGEKTREGKTSKKESTSKGQADKSPLSTSTLLGIGLIALAVVIGIVLAISARRNSARQKAALEQQRQALDREKELVRKEAASPRQPVSTTVASDSKPDQQRKKPHTVEAWGQLRVTSGPHSGLIAALSGRQITIGREEGDLQLPQDTMVSSQHGEIVATNDGRLLFVDKSRNGSIVDGTPVHRTQVDLTPNSVIEVGASRIEMVSIGPLNAGTPAQSPHPSPLKASAPSAGSKVTMMGEVPLAPASRDGNGAEAELSVVSGQDTGKRFGIYGDKAAVGRREDQDVVLTDEFVSRQHGECMKQGDNWVWRNLSDKGSMVNGERHSETVIKNGDRIAIGSTVLEFSTVKQEVSRSTPTMYDT